MFICVFPLSSRIIWFVVRTFRFGFTLVYTYYNSIEAWIYVNIIFFISELYPLSIFFFLYMLFELWIINNEIFSEDLEEKIQRLPLIKSFPKTCRRRFNHYGSFTDHRYINVNKAMIIITYFVYRFIFRIPPKSKYHFYRIVSSLVIIPGRILCIHVVVVPRFGCLI